MRKRRNHGFRAALDPLLFLGRIRQKRKAEIRFFILFTGITLSFIKLDSFHFDTF